MLQTIIENINLYSPEDKAIVFHSLQPKLFTPVRIVNHKKYLDQQGIIFAYTRAGECKVFITSTGDLHACKKILSWDKIIPITWHDFIFPEDKTQVLATFQNESNRDIVIMLAIVEKSLDNKLQMIHICKSVISNKQVEFNSKELKNNYSLLKTNDDIHDAIIGFNTKIIIKNDIID